MTSPKKQNDNARKSLAEAQKRQRDRNNKKDNPILVKEIHGRKGPEPTRYGDWEKNGITSDF